MLDVGCWMKDVIASRLGGELLRYIYAIGVVSNSPTA